MDDTAISTRTASSAASKQLDVYLLVYVPSQTSKPDWSLWICYDDKAVPRLGMRIRLVGDSQNDYKKDIDSSYNLDADKRNKQVIKLGSVDKALFTPGPRACDGTDGCIERHKAEAHPKTRACDGTDGCIERHQAEMNPGTQACDGTDGCIERHRAEILPGPDACDGTDGCIERHEANAELGTQACDGTDGCIERHKIEGRAGTKACDGTDGCIERHRNELEELALSVPGLEHGFTAPLAEHDNSPVKTVGCQSCCSIICTPWLAMA